MRPFRGTIKEFRLLPRNGGVLRVEVTGKGKPLQVRGGDQMVFDDFAYDIYYARFSPRIDKDRDSFRVRFSEV